MNKWNLKLKCKGIILAPQTGILSYKSISSYTYIIFSIYEESYKILMKYVKDGQNVQNYIPTSWTRRFKMSIFPYLTYRFIENLIKISTSFFMDFEKLILNFYREKMPQINNTIMNDKFKFGVLTSANIKTYCKGTVFKTV
jgi:hypothetical protein